MKFFLKNILLLPSESLFIDDIEINVRAAEEVGMKGLVTYGSEEISKELAAVSGELVESPFNSPSVGVGTGS